MIKLTIEGWEDGFEKVTLSKLQMNLLGKSMKESKTNVDKILEGEMVIYYIEDEKLAKKFQFEAEKIGAIFGRAK